MKKINVFTIMSSVILLTASCTSSNDFEKGKQQLEQQGYKNIQNTGYKLFGCDEKDVFRSGFTATDSNGNKVEGCFCSGVLKGVTVRMK